MSYADRCLDKISRWHKLLSSVELLQEQNVQILNKLTELGEQQMADAQSINTRLDSLDTRLTNIQIDVAELKTAIKPGMTVAETEALQLRIDGILAKAAGIDESTPPVLPPTPPVG